VTAGHVRRHFLHENCPADEIYVKGSQPLGTCGVEPVVGVCARIVDKYVDLASDCESHCNAPIDVRVNPDVDFAVMRPVSKFFHRSFALIDRAATQNDLGATAMQFTRNIKAETGRTARNDCYFSG
jgi:hypothetical protein